MLHFLTLCIKGGSCQEYQLSVDMRIPFIAGPVPVNGKLTASYELYLTNFSSDSMIVGRVEIFDASDSSIVASMSNDDLATRYTAIGFPKKPGENVLAPGNSSVITTWSLLLLKDKRPLQLGHRVSLAMLKDKNRRMLTVEGAFIQLPQKPPVILGSPLAEGAWAAVYDPSSQLGHRRVIYTADGKARIPGQIRHRPSLGWIVWAGGQKGTVTI